MTRNFLTFLYKLLLFVISKSNYTGYSHENFLF